MVRVPAGIASVSTLDDVKVGAFLIDRFEVTNRQFKAFVDRGGYRARQYWKETFTRDGRRITWDDGDAGVPGFDRPARSLDLGRRRVPERPRRRPGERRELVRGRGVRGVRGQAPADDLSLAAGCQPRLVLGGAGGQQLRRRRPGTGRFVPRHRPVRHARHGGQREGVVLERGVGEAVHARRCVESAGLDVHRTSTRARPGTGRGRTASAACATRRPTRRSTRPSGRSIHRPAEPQRPSTDEAFELFRSLYAYDPAPLDPRSEGRPLETTDWRRETVSFASAVASERITAHLYVPKHATPPYQAVIYANPGMATRLPSPEPGEERIFEFIVKSGRAFLHPALKGYYQRRYSAPAGRTERRSRPPAGRVEGLPPLPRLPGEPRAMWTRDRLAVFGLSRGASLVPILATGDDRLKAAVLFSVGLTPKRRQAPGGRSVQLPPPLQPSPR